MLGSKDGAITETDPPPPRTVYQLRVVLRGISPLIWRRLLVHGDASLADLHAALQVGFGWTGEHLHRFVVHGSDYDAYAGDDLARVGLADLMVKKQQMRWTPRGAHLLLQIRTRVLNADLAEDFQRWYPGFTHTPDREELGA